MRHRALDLEPHDLAEASLAQLLLDGHQQVGRLFLLDREVRVAGDAEEVVLNDLHAREQRVEVGGNDLLEQHVRPLAHLHEARQDRRHLDAREQPLAALRVADGDRQRQRQVADVREWVARVHGQWRQHGEYLVEEAAPQLYVALRALFVANDADAFLGELLANLRVGLGVARDHRQQPRANRVERLGRAHAVRCRLGSTCLDLALQPGDADLEELVEVAGEDRQEADPIEQRVALVDGLEQHALVELEPRQLAVDVRDVGDGASAGRDRRPGRAVLTRGRSSTRVVSEIRRPTSRPDPVTSELRPWDGSVYK